MRLRDMKKMAKLAKAARHIQKEQKKKLRRKIIIGTFILVFTVVLLYFCFNVLPLFLFSSTAASLQVNDEFIFTDNNTYKSPTVNNEGKVIALSGGLEALGVNFNTTISDLQTQYDSATDDDTKKEIAGKIAYTQLIQILNTETELTGHPVLLLGTAMLIRENSIFNSSYKSFAKNKLAGPDERLGIYGTWCSGYINGLPNNGGGVISHSIGYNVQTKYKNSPGSKVGTLPFMDLTNKVSINMDLKDQTYSSLYHRDTSDAAGYNKGAYGAVQIEADHWLSWVCPFVETTQGDYGKYKGQAFVNIPLDDRRFDNLQSAQSRPLDGYARSIVTPDKSYLKVYRQNKIFVDNIMATVGHSDYIQEFANIVNNTTEGKNKFGAGTGYYFAGRFTNGQDWEDWALSLEAWPHALTCFVVDRLANFMMFDNIGEIKNSKGEIVANSAWKARLIANYGTEFTFVNKTAEEIYWTLELLQSWNYGNVSCAYNEKDYPYRYNMAWFYRELANYIAIHGTSEIRSTQAINPVGTCTCGSGSSHRVVVYSGGGEACTAYQCQVYLKLTDFLCEKNGTSDAIRKKIKEIFTRQQSQTYHKNNYGYAITGLFDAETYMQSLVRELFGIEDFNIFNYGIAAAQTSTSTTADYDYTKQAPASTAVNSNYFSDALFIGDSLTEGLSSSVNCTAKFYAKTGGTASRAISDNTAITLNGTSCSIIDAVKQSSFSKIYIMYGINDANATVNTFMQDYETLIDTIQTYNPNAIIYIQSIFPVKEDSEYGKTISNDTIKEKNNILRQIAQRKKCIYVNVREIFENSDNTYKNDLFTDGLHLSGTAYTSWFNYLKNHTVQATTSQTTTTQEEGGQTE